MRIGCICIFVVSPFFVEAQIRVYENCFYHIRKYTSFKWGNRMLMGLFHTHGNFHDPYGLAPFYTSTESPHRFATFPAYFRSSGDGVYFSRITSTGNWWQVVQSVSGVLPNGTPYQLMFTKPDLLISISPGAAENGRQAPARSRAQITITAIPEKYRQ